MISRATNRPWNLRVEHLDDAFGIDVLRPRLSWKLPHGAEHQFAHQVRTETGSKVPKDRPYLALYSPRFAEEHPEHVAEDVRAGSAQGRRPRARRRQWQSLRGWDAWDRIRSLGCPVLVLHGTEDRVIPVENGKRLAAAIPGARLVLIEGAGHVYHSEQPEVADRAILDFLREIAAG